MIDSPWNLSLPTPPATGALGPASTKKQIEKAVAGFESVLLREWLRQVRNTSLTGESAMGSAGYLEMVDDQMASFVSRQGGLGLTRQMADQLLNQVKAASLITQPDPVVKPFDMREVGRE